MTHRRSLHPHKMYGETEKPIKPRRQDARANSKTARLYRLPQEIFPRGSHHGAVLRVIAGQMQAVDLAADIPLLEAEGIGAQPGGGHTHLANRLSAGDAGMKSQHGIATVVEIQHRVGRMDRITV